MRPNFRAVLVSTKFYFWGWYHAFTLSEAQEILTGLQILIQSSMKTIFHVVHVKVQSDISVQTTFEQNSLIELCCIATNCSCERFCEFHSSNSFYDLKKLLRIENFWKEMQPLMDSYTIDKRIFKWEMVGKNPKHILLVHADTLQPMSLYYIGYLYRSLPLCVFFIYSDGTSYAESSHYIPLMVPGLLLMSRGRDHL